MDKQLIVIQILTVFFSLMLSVAISVSFFHRQNVAKEYIEKCEEKTNDYAGCYDRFYEKKENK